MQMAQKQYAREVSVAWKTRCYAASTENDCFSFGFVFEFDYCDRRAFRGGAICSWRARICPKNTIQSFNKSSREDAKWFDTKNDRFVCNQSTAIFMDALHFMTHNGMCTVPEWRSRFYFRSQRSESIYGSENSSLSAGSVDWLMCVASRKKNVSIAHVARDVHVSQR